LRAADVRCARRLHARYEVGQASGVWLRQGV